MLSKLEIDVNVANQIQIHQHLTDDNYPVESIAYYGDMYKKNIIAITNQIGCPVKCKFCVVGEMDFKRNIKPEEYLQQVDAFMERGNIRCFDKNKILKVSFCRAGEPLLNRHTFSGIEAIAEKYHPQIQILTVMPDTSVARDQLANIINFAERYENVVQLAISMHNGDEDKRKEMIPFKKLMSFDDIAEFGEEYSKINKRKINLHFALMSNININLEEIRKKFSPEYFTIRCGIYLPSTADYAKNYPQESLKKLKEMEMKAKGLGYMFIESLARPVEFKYDVRSHCTFKFIRENYLKNVV